MASRGCVVGAFTLGCVTGVFALAAALYRHNKELRRRERPETEHERDMKNYYEYLATDRFVAPYRLRPKNLSVILGYDPTNKDLASLSSFQVVKQNVECIFAKGARIWGSADWDRQRSLEENVHQSLRAFGLFMSSQKSLDGFLFEIPTPDCGDNVEAFGEAVRRLLTCLSEADPDGYHCMRKSFVDRKGWVFRFAGEEAFVTSFSPVYPEMHPRHSFGATSAYVLFQPYHSFLTHGVGTDTPHTNWENPVTSRDRIRCRFYANGRPYLIRDTVAFPAAHDIVKPLGMHDPPVPWWCAPKCPFLAGSSSDGSGVANLDSPDGLEK